MVRRVVRRGVGMESASMLVFALQVLLAAMLFAAAAGKALRSDEFLAALRLSHLPDAAALPLAVAVPVAEAALGFWLLLARPTQLPAAFAASGALLLLFT
ncbi:MAG: hypothetical protein IT337_02220, partial [Thermomicrobiales bacterium]|nr:hypothetical protein [Thermomicrobiales bacterium]